jgi:hypothetical protein
VADSVSQTRRVRVEFENTESWPAGIPVMVRFTDPGQEWAEHVLSPTKQPISRGDGAGATVTKEASVSDAR